MLRSSGCQCKSIVLSHSKSEVYYTKKHLPNQDVNSSAKIYIIHHARPGALQISLRTSLLTHGKQPSPAKRVNTSLEVYNDHRMSSGVWDGNHVSDEVILALTRADAPITQ